MPSKNSGHGIKLMLSDGAEYTAIAQIENVQPPGWERGVEDAPTHDDPVGSGMDRIAHALYSGTPVVVTILYDPADLTHKTVEGLKRATAPSDWKVLYPLSPAAEVDFTAWMTGWVPQGVDANSGLLRSQMTLTPTGDLGDPTEVQA